MAKIVLEESPRPADDDWRKYLERHIKGHRELIEPFLNYEFIACDVCRAKPGTPALCLGCLLNRETIDALRKKLT